jgi:hypothetical protein
LHDHAGPQPIPLEHAGLEKTGFVEIDRSAPNAGGLRICAATVARGLQLDWVVGAEGAEPQIDQFDRLAFEEESIALALKPPERVDEGENPRRRHRAGLR